MKLVDDLKGDQKNKSATAALILSTQGAKAVPVLTDYLQTVTSPTPVIESLSALAKQNRRTAEVIELELIRRAQTYLRLYELDTVDAYTAHRNFLQSGPQLISQHHLEFGDYIDRLETLTSAMPQNANRIGYEKSIKSARNAFNEIEHPNWFLMLID